MIQAKIHPDSYLLALCTRIAADGVPLPPAAMIDAVVVPHWTTARPRHDWRTYVPPLVRQEWETLPIALRLYLFEMAELAALAEEHGAAMVTGPQE